MPSGSLKSYENCFRIKYDQQGSTKGGGGTRKAVQGLSKGSRRRMLSIINSLAHTGDAFFVTLTVKEASENFEQWKKWLHRTLRGLRYHFPKLSGIWRLEFQKRGSPHFHFLLYTNSAIDLKELQGTIHKYWSSACGKQNTGSMGTKNKSNTCERIRDIRKSGFYLSIYQSKDEQDRKDIPTGRLWGVINKQNLPIAEYSGVEFEGFHFVTYCKRIYRRYIRANGAFTRSPLFYSLKSRDSGFTGFLSRKFQRKFIPICQKLSRCGAHFDDPLLLPLRERYVEKLKKVA